VLAGDGIDREWAYVALSRGRHANHLYVAATPDDERAEFAPSSPTARDPIQRLARQLERSSAQVLAIDAGRPSEPDERRRFRWLPGRRHEPQAREGEDAERRQRAEAAHGGLPFDAEQQFDASSDRLHRSIAERETERILRRNRGIGRER
jgi:hypothetical protein